MRKLSNTDLRFVSGGTEEASSITTHNASLQYFDAVANIFPNVGPITQISLVGSTLLVTTGNLVEIGLITAASYAASGISYLAVQINNYLYD